jgi:hypothetical protein
MQDAEAPRARRRLAIDLSELDLAFDEAPGEARWYLDLETGQVIRIGDEVRQELEDLDEEIGDNGALAFADALAQRDLPDWLREAVEEAHAVDAGYGTRFVEVPGADSRESYQDMTAFVDTVADSRLQDRLWKAIRGRGAFRRFKDVLADHPREQERWFAYRDARLRQRVLRWLEAEGVEPIGE